MPPELPYESLAEHQSTHGPSVLQVRGSLLASSLATLRSNNLFDNYLQHLPADQHERVLYVLAASWVPVDVAMAHYSACDAMQLSEPQLDAMGRNVSERIMGTFLGTLVKTARLVITPKSVPLRQYPKLWERLFVGGGCSVGTLGESGARIESRGVPMFRYRYFRVAYAGVIRGASLMFRSNVQARVRKYSDESLVIDVNWA